LASDVLREQARKAVQSNPSEMVTLCNQLLEYNGDREDLDAAVRVGDVFALLIEFHAQQVPPWSPPSPLLPYRAALVLSYSYGVE
jgi:hypothetical protein